MMNRTIPDAILLSTTPKKIKQANINLIGQTMQNQESTANIFVRCGGDGAPRSYLKLQPMGDMQNDILPPQDEVWAYSDVEGAILTYWEKYRA